MVLPVADQKAIILVKLLVEQVILFVGVPESRNKLAVKSDARCVPNVGGEET